MHSWAGGGELAQERVAPEVAVAVVVALEVVEVDDGDAQRGAGAPGPRHLGGDDVVPAAAVGQAGQRVPLGRVGEALQEFGAFGGVGDLAGQGLQDGQHVLGQLVADLAPEHAEHPTVRCPDVWPDSTTGCQAPEATPVRFASRWEARGWVLTSPTNTGAADVKVNPAREGSSRG